MISRKNLLKAFLCLSLVGASATFSGCTKEEKTVGGVVLGAGLGAGIGAAAGGGGGAVAGGAIGGLAGGLIGISMGDDTTEKK